MKKTARGVLAKCVCVFIERWILEMVIDVNVMMQKLIRLMK